MRQVQMNRFVVPVVLTVLMGCGAGNGPAEVKRPAPTTPAATAAPIADLTVAAQQLAKDYATDEVAAAGKYKGKVVRVDGELHKVTKDRVGVVILELKGEGEMVVRCGIPADAASVAQAFTMGQKVSVVGNCYGKLGNAVSVDSCEFVK